MKLMVLGAFHNATDISKWRPVRQGHCTSDELRFIYAPLFKVEKPGALLNAVWILNSALIYVIKFNILDISNIFH